MPTEIPHYIHSFHLTSATSSAVTYRFKPSALARDGRTASHVSGWAIATVNDDTGELNIQSDWGNYAHRWNTDHIGSVGGVPDDLATTRKQVRDGTYRPKKRQITLTEFIAEGDCNYLARKLTPPSEREAFDFDATVLNLRRMLVEHRIEAVRSAIERYADDDPKDRPDVCAAEFNMHDAFYGRRVAVRIHGYDETWGYSKITVRNIYDEIGRLNCNDERDFLDGFFRIEGYALVTEEPWEHTRHAPTGWANQLEFGILPALVLACRERCPPDRPRRRFAVTIVNTKESRARPA